MNLMIGQFIHLLFTSKRPDLCYRPSEVLQMFQGVARWIPHAISPFMDLQGAMCSALPTSIVTAFTAGAVYLANWGVTTGLTASMTVNALMTGIPWRRNLWASLAGGNFVLSSLNQT